MASESTLWQRVNALGGVPHSEYERGHNDAMSEALSLIERHHEGLVEALRAIADGGEPQARRLAADALRRSHEQASERGMSQRELVD